MIRFLSRALFLGASLSLAAGASVARAEDTATSVNYFLPVTYQMVVTRHGATTTTDTGQKAALTFETFGNRDILRVILGDESIKNWSLVAAGDSTQFGGAEVPFETLRLVARHRKTHQVRELPEGASFTLDLSAAIAYSSTQVHQIEATEDAEAGELLRGGSGITQVAELNQAIPGSGAITDAIGQLIHGTVYNTVAGASNLGPVLRPTAASFRAVGGFATEGEGEDGLVELRITFGTPALVPVEAD